MASGKVGVIRDYTNILTPILSEKGNSEVEGRVKVAFRIKSGISKDEVKLAVERVFGVKVAAVRTVNCTGKPKNSLRGKGRSSAYKKAYVTLKEGERLDLIEGV